MTDTVSEADNCLLLNLYEITEELITDKLVAAVAHLVHQHNSIEAAELSLALLRFVVFAGRREAEVFAANDITTPPHYDPAGDSAMLREVEGVVGNMRLAAAITEGESSVKH